MMTCLCCWCVSFHVALLRVVLFCPLFTLHKVVLPRFALCCLASCCFVLQFVGFGSCVLCCVVVFLLSCIAMRSFCFVLQCVVLSCLVVQCLCCFVLCCMSFHCVVLQLPVLCVFD